MNRKAGTTRTQDGKLDSTAGRHTLLDSIAEKFLTGDQKALLVEAEEAVKTLAGDALAIGKIYAKYMSTIVEKGKEWVETEVQRLERLSSGSVTPAKADDLTRRKNILSAFK